MIDHVWKVRLGLLQVQLLLLVGSPPQFPPRVSVRLEVDYKLVVASQLLSWN